MSRASGHRQATQSAIENPLSAELIVSFFVAAFPPFAFAGLSMGTAVTANAIVEIANALFLMLGPDARGRMLMTAVAGVALVILSGVAGHTGHAVIAVQKEIAVVIEGCRLPARGLMTLRTRQIEALMQRVLRRPMASLALAAHDGRQPRMIERLRRFRCQTRSGMITVAG